MTQSSFRFVLASALVLAQLTLVETVRGGDDSPELLPDIVVPRSYLFDHDFRRRGGRTLLRLSNGTANVGTGPLHLYGVTPGNGDGTQPVNQRIYRQNGSTYDREAGSFLYHPTHNHIHFNNWAHYKLRRRIGNDGVGDVVAEGEKTSFCIIDLSVYDRGLPNYVPGGRFRSCSSTTQGLSVGWIDIYDKSLSGQDIDVTDVPDGHYWLESVVDPDNHVVESNENNNVTRIPITIGNPPDVEPDSYETNDSLADVQELVVGRPNSSNFGPVDPKLTLSNMTIHERGNDDFYRFYINSDATPLDFVRVDFRNSAGNIDLELYSDDGTLLGSSETSANAERISFGELGIGEGWYVARVFGRDGDVSPDYELTVNPPTNSPPSIDTLTPPEGETVVLHGLELYDVNWAVEDTENNEMWVSIYFNTEPVLDENEFLVPTTVHTPADLAFTTINTAEVEPGSYWVYCQVSDGGTTTGAWSQGMLTIVELNDECVALVGGPHDCNDNRVIDSCEIELGLSADCNENGQLDSCDLASGTSVDDNADGIPDDCQQTLTSFHRADPNEDGRLDVSDAVTILGYLFEDQGELNCAESADTNNDNGLDVSDVIFALQFLFRGGDAPPPPGPPGDGVCGLDADDPGSPDHIGCESYDGC